MKCILSFVCCALSLAWVGTVGAGELSAEQADAALLKASRDYQELARQTKEAPNMYTFDDLEGVQVWYEVDDSVAPDLSHPHYFAGQNASEVNLEDLMLRVDLENVTLTEALHRVVNRIGDQTGPWQLRWRLKPENASLKEETINLIAESSFGEFVAYLAERVKNMTGIQLFVAVFDGARVIVISDTYH